MLTVFKEHISQLHPSSFEELRSDVANNIKFARRNGEPINAHYANTLPLHMQVYLRISDRVKSVAKTTRVADASSKLSDTYDRKLSNTRGFPFSNEARFGDLESEIRQAKGVIIATGSDQGLHLLAMAPKTTELHIVDWGDHSQAVSRIYLEVGLRLKKLLGRAPTKEEYIPFFDQSQRTLLADLLSLSISDRYQADREKALQDVNKLVYWETSDFHVPYLEYFSSKYSGFWVNHLPKIIEMYENGNITLHRGNLFGGDAIKAIKSNLKKRHEKIGILYLSNAASDKKSLRKLKNFLYESMTDETAVIMTENASYQFPFKTIDDPAWYNLQHEWAYLIHSRDTMSEGWQIASNREITYQEIKDGVYSITRKRKNKFW